MEGHGSVLPIDILIGTNYNPPVSGSWYKCRLDNYDEGGRI